MTVVVLLLIIVVATALRTWQLGTMPLGLHNDEAWTGLNAREILRDGYVGPYLYPSGLGQPSGPVYFTALFFLAVPQNTFTLRLSMALFGIAAVVLTYAAGRAMFGPTVGLFAAALLAIMPWHLHLSRIAFMVNAWPCIELAIIWAIFAARRRPSILAYAVVGALIGLGVYTYNAYPLFIPVAAAPFVYEIIAARDPETRRRWLVRSAAATVTAIWAAALMVHYASLNREFFWHHRDVSVLYSPRWPTATWRERADIVGERAVEWAKGVFRGGRPDDGDALGQEGHPLVDPLTAIAALVGLIMTVRHWRQPSAVVLLLALLVLPFGALLTVNDGLYRRTFGLTPFIALLAALPLAWLWERARTWGGARGAAVTLAIVAALSATAARNAYAYFGPLQRSEKIRSVYPYQVDAAARAIAQLPAGTAVYFYSDRWGAGFETIKWLAPDVLLEDRSRQFRKDVPPTAPLDLSADGAHPTAFVLLGRYLDLADDIRRRFPTSDLRQEKLGDEVLYRIVVLGRGRTRASKHGGVSADNLVAGPRAGVLQGGHAVRSQPQSIARSPLNPG